MYVITEWVLGDALPHVPEIERNRAVYLLCRPGGRARFGTRSRLQCARRRSRLMEAEVAVPPRLFQRIAPEAHGDLISISVRDHYVDVVTSAGQASLLMRLSDAMAEADGCRRGAGASVALGGVECGQGCGAGRREAICRDASGRTVSLSAAITGPSWNSAGCFSPIRAWHRNGQGAGAGQNRKRVGLHKRG